MTHKLWVINWTDSNYCELNWIFGDDRWTGSSWAKKLSSGETNGLAAWMKIYGVFHRWPDTDASSDTDSNTASDSWKILISDSDSAMESDEVMISESEVLTRTRVRKRSCLKTSDTDQHRTRVSAHLWCVTFLPCEWLPASSRVSGFSSTIWADLSV